MTCLTLNSLGLHTCSEESRGTWRIWDCGPPDTEVRTYPFGWYQKPGKWCAPGALWASSVDWFPDMYSDDVLGPGRRLFRFHWGHTAEAGKEFMESLYIDSEER